MEQTYDCLHCGSRWDFKGNCENRDIETIGILSDWWRKKHLDCQPSPKGDSLKAYNEWYFQDSQIIFDANLNQLYKLIKKQHKNMTYKDFLKEYNSSDYMTFGNPYYKSLEVHRLWPKWRYFIFEQMWERQDLFKALKSVGAKVVSRKERMPKPRSQYNWEPAKIISRAPERIWN